MLTALVRGVKDHPVLSSLWGLFASSFFYLVHHEYTSEQQIAALRTSAVQVQHKLDDFQVATKAVALRDKAYSRLGTHDWRLLSEDLKRDLRGATKRVILTYAADRQAIEKDRIVLSSLYLEDAALRDVQAAVVKDLEELDAFLARRIEILTQAPGDSLEFHEQWRELKENKDGRRYGMGADARSVTNDHILDRVRENYNASVATYNADSKMFKWRSRLAVAAWAYIVACLGAFVGWHMRRRRRGKFGDPETTAPLEKKVSGEIATTTSSARGK